LIVAGGFAAKDENQFDLGLIRPRKMIEAWAMQRLSEGK
jgi:hypothetical protein